MTRDIKGPSPQQYGILAKFPSQNQSQMLYAKNMNLNNKMLEMKKENNRNASESLKIDFFDDADRKARNNKVKKTVEEMMNSRNFLLNERRVRLKQFLTNEHKEYEREILSSTVSPIERAAQLREQAKQIRAQKATEHAQFVSEKLDQKWRSECDELRTYQAKHLQSGMGREHMLQIEDKIWREKEELAEEGVFAEMWYQDGQAKNRREEEKVRVRKEKNIEVSGLLKEQMEVLERQRMETKRIRNETAKLLKEKANIENLERQLLFRKKREEQAERRHELDFCVRAKMINEKRRLQEENAFDLKCLEDSLISFQNEDEEKAQRKHELMIEQQHYRRYLQELHEEEKTREKELDAIIEEDTEKMFQKQLNRLRAQKTERKRLLEDTLAGRKKQIEEKIARNGQRQVELERERVEFNREVEAHKAVEIDEWVQSREKIQEYRGDLIGQMTYNESQKRLFDESKPEEFRNYLRTEEEYDRKLNAAMNNLKYEKGNRII